MINKAAEYLKNDKKIYMQNIKYEFNIQVLWKIMDGFLSELVEE